MDEFGNEVKEESARSIAIFDPTYTYRYSIIKEWKPNKKRAVAVLYNPGTGYVKETGHTINNILLAVMKDDGFGSLEVVNLYAKIGMQGGALPDSEKSRGETTLSTSRWL